MDFPDSPSIGATVNNGISTWAWNGKQWERAGSGGGGGEGGTDSPNYRYLRAGASAGGDGLSWATAWNNLSQASGLTAGQTLWMASGTYPNGSMAAGGSSGSPVTYKAATATSHGTGTGWNAATMAVDGAAGPVTFTTGIQVGASFITIDGQTRASLTSGHGIRAMAGDDGGDNPKIRAYGTLRNNLTIRYVRCSEVTSPNAKDTDGIQGNGNNLLVEYCFFQNNDNDDAVGTHGDGIQWFSGDNITVRYNFFRHCGQHITFGWTTEDPSTVSNVSIYYNVFDDLDAGSGRSAGWALNAGGSDPGQAFISNFKFWNNTIGHITVANLFALYPNSQRGNINVRNNAFYNVQCNEFAPTVHSFNGYHNGSSGACTNVPTETGRVLADLVLVNAPTGDYRLTSSSPLRGVGTNVGLTMDILGNTVPSTPDIGAFQF